MARRTTPAKNGRTARRTEAAPAPADPVIPERPRRGRKLKLRESQAVVAPAEDEAPDGTAPEPDAAPAPVDMPAKPRRGRKPKVQSAPDAPVTEDDPETAIVAELEQAAAGRKGGTVAAGTPAAHWNAVTGEVVFDWPAIEHVAGQVGPNQAMARLLLAARAEGASSRWPF